MDDAAWQHGMKARLREVVSDEGKQVKLAKKLGIKQGQVSDWVTDGKGLPAAHSLHLLRAECRVDLNWLVNGLGEPPTKSEGRWTAARRQKLANELAEYGLNLLYGRERIPFGVRVVEAPSSEKLNPLLCAWVATRGDFLKFFATELGRLGDVMAAMCEGLDPDTLARRIKRPPQPIPNRGPRR